MKQLLLILAAFIVLGCSDDIDDNATPATGYLYTKSLKMPAWLRGTWGPSNGNGGYEPYFKFKENDICRIRDNQEVNCLIDELGYFESNNLLSSVGISYDTTYYGIMYIRGGIFSTSMGFYLQPDGTILWEQAPGNKWKLYKIE